MPIPNSNDASGLKFQRISNAAWLAKIVETAVEAGVFDALGQEPANADDLAKALGYHGPTVYRLLRALAANGITSELDGQRFEHNELSARLRADHPQSLRSLVLLPRLEGFSQAWDGLRLSLRDGDSGFKHANGEYIYERLARDPEAAAAFNQAMVSISTQTLSQLSCGFPFYKYRKVLDIAGGMGQLLAAILQEYPSVEGAVLDLPHAEAACKTYLQSQGVSDRGRFVEGNFFEKITPGADLYMIKNTLWNWSDEACVRILGNVRKALGTEKGRLLIIESLIRPDNVAESTVFDIGMLVMTQGGRTRTSEEHERNAKAAGFTLQSERHLVDNSILEFTPI